MRVAGLTVWALGRVANLTLDPMAVVADYVLALLGMSPAARGLQMVPRWEQLMP